MRRVLYATRELPGHLITPGLAPRVRASSNRSRNEFFRDTSGTVSTRAHLGKNELNYERQLGTRASMPRPLLGPPVIGTFPGAPSNGVLGEIRWEGRGAPSVCGDAGGNRTSYKPRALSQQTTAHRRHSLLLVLSPLLCCCVAPCVSEQCQQLRVYRSGRRRVVTEWALSRASSFAAERAPVLPWARLSYFRPHSSGPATRKPRSRHLVISHFWRPRHRN